jgi:hypothetical protein
VKLRIAALLVLLATAAAGVVPCPTPPEAVSSLRTASSQVPPFLVPACHCGCKQRPSAAGTPTAPGFALRSAAIPIELPLGSTPLPEASPQLVSVHPDAPEPVPLVVA